MTIRGLAPGDVLPGWAPKELLKRLNDEPAALFEHPKLPGKILSDIGEEICLAYYIEKMTPRTIDEARKMFEKKCSASERYQAGAKAKGMDISGLYKNRYTEYRWQGYIDALRDIGVLIE